MHHKAQEQEVMAQWLQLNKSMDMPQMELQMQRCHNQRHRKGPTQTVSLALVDLVHLFMAMSVSSEDAPSSAATVLQLLVQATLVP